MDYIFETILKEIKTSGKTRYRISKDTGISQQTLFNILHNNSRTETDTASKLLEYFGYELQKRGK
ncbi:helix-turn-helix domain-containing protein [Sedimentisphaera salicampi]|uniref:helix-turn-helix domain-containing protein n=1 Tax=Sedimentisphaera salicampi TaxID=1941349 RepID=UPI000B9B35B0|nr:helix-turn-helix domain-containing protein [Sedimentisphaera salicampi]OXU15399.1 hypothetical protein SMSP1_00880 [Sedimentisphaera salicampi]